MGQVKKPEPCQAAAGRTAKAHTRLYQSIHNSTMILEAVQWLTKILEQEGKNLALLQRANWQKNNPAKRESKI